jgi:hypothetical protein
VAEDLDTLFVGPIVNDVAQEVGGSGGMLSKKLPLMTLQRTAKPAAYKFSFVRSTTSDDVGST